MKSLFTDKARYTMEAHELSNEVFPIIRKVFDKYLALGYSPRDISSIMQWAVTDCELYAVLEFSGPAPDPHPGKKSEE